MLIPTLALSLIALDSPPAPRATVAPAVHVDSAGERIVVATGPLTQCASAGDPAAQERPASFRFSWDVSGYLRGFRAELSDRDGHPLSRDHLRYAGLASLARRELLYPQLQRIVGVSSETDAVSLPRFLGVPIEYGDSLLLYACLIAPQGDHVDGASVTFILDYTPRTRFLRPLAILPWHADVNFAPGNLTTYDLPPGRSSRSAEFVPPVSGLVLALGGHLRDYGTSLTLVDCATGKAIVELDADRRSDGTIKGVSRFVFGFHGSAMLLEAGHRYRLTATYDNPTGRTIQDGGESSIAGPFVPLKGGVWPPLDLKSAEIIADIASL